MIEQAKPIQIGAGSPDRTIIRTIGNGAGGGELKRQARSASIMVCQNKLAREHIEQLIDYGPGQNELVCLIDNTPQSGLVS